MKNSVLGVLMGLTVVAVGQNAFAASENLVKVLVEKRQLTEDQAEQTVAQVFETIQSELQDGREVQVRNFGRFHLQEMKPRTGRNPRTGAAIEIPARRYARFASSDTLKDRLNGETKETKAVKKTAAKAPKKGAEEAVRPISMTK